MQPSLGRSIWWLREERLWLVGRTDWAQVTNHSTDPIDFRLAHMQASTWLPKCWQGRSECLFSVVCYVSMSPAGHISIRENKYGSHLNGRRENSLIEALATEYTLILHPENTWLVFISRSPCPSPHPWPGSVHAQRVRYYDEGWDACLWPHGSDRSTDSWCTCT